VISEAPSQWSRDGAATTGLLRLQTGSEGLSKEGHCYRPLELTSVGECSDGHDKWGQVIQDEGWPRYEDRKLTAKNFIYASESRQKQYSGSTIE
jgi:hypothetical protein